MRMYALLPKYSLGQSIFAPDPNFVTLFSIAGHEFFNGVTEILIVQLGDPHYEKDIYNYILYFRT